MRLISLSVSALALTALAAAPLAAQDGSGLVGAWVVESIEGGNDWQSDPGQPGLYIFTEGGHYSAFHSIGKRTPAASRFAPTDQEKVAEHETMIVNTGTYEVSGDKITYRPMIAKSAGYAGGEAVQQFKIDGDRLTLSRGALRSSDGTEIAAEAVLTLRRVE